MSFPGTLKPHKFQKVARGCAPSNPASRGDTPLKIPPVVYILVPRRGEKPLVFLRFFVFFNLAQFHHKKIILTLFAQVMVSKASVTNYDA